MLTFDDASHTYRWNGRTVPGVTSLLQPIHDFSKVPADVLRMAQERGTYVHRMTELFDLGELDEDANASVADGLYARYLVGWKRFLVDYAPNWAEIEEKGYSKLFGFAGTWDRAGRFERRDPGRWLVDIKTSLDPADAWGVQVAAYRQLRMERDASTATDRRGTVQLNADGSYSLIEWTGSTDWDCFHALLTLHNWRASR